MWKTDEPGREWEQGKTARILDFNGFHKTKKKKNVRNIIGMIILAHRLNMFESTNEKRFSQQVPRSGRSRTQIAAPHFTIFVLPPYPFVLLQICAFGFKVEAHYIFKVSLLGGYNYA